MPTAPGALWSGWVGGEFHSTLLAQKPTMITFNKYSCTSIRNLCDKNSSEVVWRHDLSSRRVRSRAWEAEDVDRPFADSVTGSYLELILCLFLFLDVIISSVVSHGPNPMFTGNFGVSYKNDIAPHLYADATQQARCDEDSVVGFWILAPCKDVTGYQCFGGPCFLHLQVNLMMVGILYHHYTVS